MSKFLKPCLYKNGALELQFLNAVHGIHDLMCGCNDPIEHLVQIKQRRECPHTENTTAASTTTAGTTEEDILENGDLDELFKISDDAEG